jgi:hypothetical protein
VWQSDDQEDSASEQFLAVLAPSHYLLIQHFGGSFTNPTGSGSFRSVELAPGAPAHPAPIDQTGGTVQLHGTWAGGAGLIVTTNDLVISHFYRDGAWQRTEVVTTTDAEYAIGRAKDGVPLVAVGFKAKPTEVTLFRFVSSGFEEQTLSIADNDNLLAVGEDAAGRIHLWRQEPGAELHHVYETPAQDTVVKMPSAGGTPYFLFPPGAPARLFLADEVFNSYEGRVVALDDQGSWATYELPFAGSPHGHGLFDGDLEHLYRYRSNAKLYACRRGQAAWTSVDLGVSGIGSVLAEAVQRDANQLVAAARPTSSTQSGNRVVTLPLADCLVP